MPCLCEVYDQDCTCGPAPRLSSEEGRLLEREALKNDVAYALVVDRGHDDCSEGLGCGCRVCFQFQLSHGPAVMFNAPIMQYLEGKYCERIVETDNHFDLMIIFNEVQRCKRLSPKLKKNFYDNIRSKLGRGPEWILTQT